MVYYVQRMIPLDRKASLYSRGDKFGKKLEGMIRTRQKKEKYKAQRKLFIIQIVHQNCIFMPYIFYY